jgi:hypothetical protein
MSKASKVPFAWSEIEAEIRECILGQASIIANFGTGDRALVASFLGLEVDDGYIDPTDPNDERLASIDLSRHLMFGMVERAYAFAYQLDGCDEATTEDYHDIACGLLNGYAQSDSQGAMNSLNEGSERGLRPVLETFLARWGWTHDGVGLTIRGLALLANMSEQTVRSSLSKEGFRMELNERDEKDPRNELAPGQAMQWLSKRRSFIPNRGGVEPALRRAVVHDFVREGYFDPLPAVLTQILDAIDMSVEQLIERANVPAPWLRDLIAGKVVTIDIEAFKNLADALDAHRSSFVGLATRHLIEIAESQASANKLKSGLG